MSETLTRERVLAMPAGPVLDASVAHHVMGWRAPIIEAAIEQGSRLQPDYSTDIRAAWAVVEHASPPDSRAPVLQLKHVWGSYHHPHPVYVCNLGGGWAEGEAAPLAICRAALLAVLERSQP